MSRRTLAGSSYPHLFAWLGKHTPGGDVVAYDRHLEFMTWSFADYGVPLLFGIPPLPTQNSSDYAGRYSAWFWLVNAPHAAPAGCLVRKYAIAYVVVGGVRIPGWAAHYNRRQLKSSKNVRLVHQDGALTVYQVTPRGRACPPSA